MLSLLVLIALSGIAGNAAAALQCPDPWRPSFSPFTRGFESRCTTTPHNRKWTSYLRRGALSNRTLDKCLTDATSCADHTLFPAWKDHLEKNRGKAPLQIVRNTNRFFNGHVTYASDEEAYKASDYWESLVEILRAGRGDCDGYAIAKFETLKRLLPAGSYEDLRVHIVFDQALEIGHFVTGVRFGDTTYLLDNRSDDLIRYADIEHFIPAFSANEEGQWCHYNYNAAGYGCPYNVGRHEILSAPGQGDTGHFANLGGCNKSADSRRAAGKVAR